MLIASIVIFAITGLVIVFLALRSPILFKIAIRNFIKRKKSSVLAICGLLVSSAIISGALTVGDSMENAVIQSAYANLGETDEVVQSHKSFNYALYESLKNDTILDQMIDGTAPLIILPASVVNRQNSLRESTSTVIGYNNDFLQFGNLIALDGSAYSDELISNEASINEKLASRINADVGNVITLGFRSPEFSIETVYSQLVNLTQQDFIVKQVVKDESLGRFQLGSGSPVSNNVFVNLTFLQNISNMESSINAVLVSNNGGVEEGVELTGDVSQRIETILDDAIGYDEVGFHVVATDDYIKIEHGDIFFQGRYLSQVESASDSVGNVSAISPLTSYFVNTIISGNESIHYLTVTGFIPQVDAEFGLFTENGTGLEIVGDIEDDEIIITNYVAEWMGIGVGSPLTINYSVYDNTFKENFKLENFTVRYVVDIAGKADDEELMPPFPGIRGKENFDYWDPPMESFNKSLINVDDCIHWVSYYGTAENYGMTKAYITLNKAKQLWTNDLGNLTTIKVRPSQGTNSSLLAPSLGEQLNLSIGHKDAGISVSNIKLDSINSAKGVQILTETFIAFGAVVIIAGMVLIVMLVGALVEERKREIGTMRALGSKRGQVAKQFVFEGAALSSIASFIGIFVGVTIAYICIYLTNTYWPNIVEGNVISLHFTYTTIVVGFVAGFLIALITFALASYAASGMRITDALKEAATAEVGAERRRAPIAFTILGILCTLSFLLLDLGESLSLLAGLLGPVLIILAIPFLSSSYRRIGMAIAAPVAILYTVLFDIFYAAPSTSSFILFFLSGFIIVIACVLAIALNFRTFAAADRWLLGKLKAKTAVVTVALLNPIRRLGRTALSIALFAIIIFTLVALSANIAGQQINLENAVKEQGGGYDVIGETSVSLRFDLGNLSARSEEGLGQFPSSTSVVQFLTFGSPGGTCTNLNKDLPPRLIGANESFIQDNQLKFSSALNHDIADSDLIWSDLEVSREDGAIPALGELNTVIWILQKDLNDYIEIIDEFGQTRKLVIVGILQNSVFPGSMFISENNIDMLYPIKAEYNFFLFKTPEPSSFASYLETELGSYGMDAREVEEVVKENLSVEWSYMSLFQSLLIFGLFVGTAGLALRTAKAVFERRKEIGILRALGFTRNMVLKTFLLESIHIALIGILIGIISGMLVSILFFGPTSGAGYGAVIPWVAIAIIAIVVFIASIISAALPSLKAARMEPVDALRKYE